MPCLWKNITFRGQGKIYAKIPGKNLKKYQNLDIDF